MSDPLARFVIPSTPQPSSSSVNTKDPLSQFVIGGGDSSNTPNISGGGASWDNNSTTDLTSGVTTPTAPTNAPIPFIRNESNPALGQVSRMEQFGAGGLGELLKVPQTIANAAADVKIPGAVQASNYLDQVADQATNFGSRQLAGGSVSQFLSSGSGKLIGDAAIFSGVSGAVKGLAGAAEYAMPSAFARSTTAISNAAKYAKGIADQLGVSTKIASWIGAGVGRLPENLAAGLGFQAITDPNSLTEPSGAATVIGAGILGAGIEGLTSNAKSVLSVSNAKTVADEIANSGLPQYSQNIRSAIYNPASAEPSIPSVRQLWTKLVAFGQNKNAALGAFEKDASKLSPSSTTALHQLPSELAQLNNGTNARAEQFLRSQPFVQDYATGTPVFDYSVPSHLTNLAANAPTKADQAALDDLLLAQRSLDPRVVNSPTPIFGTNPKFSPQDATQEIANAPDNLKLAADNFRNLIQAGRRYAENGGLIDPAQGAVWDMDNPNYVPLHRALVTIIDPGLKPVDNTFGVGQIVRNLFGSDNQVLSPQLNGTNFIKIAIKAADRNMVGQHLLNIASNLSDADAETLGIKVLSPADKWSNPKFYETADKLKASALDMGYGLDDTQAQSLVAQYGRSFDPTSNILSVQNSGGVTKLQLSPELAQVYQNMSPKQLPIWVKLLGIPAQTLRTGITSALDFTGATFIRNAFIAPLQSEYGFRLGTDSFSDLIPKLKASFTSSFKGLAESGRNGPARQEWMAAGGGYGDIGSMGNINPNNPFHAITPQTPLQTIGNVFLHPIDALREIGRPFEEAARLGEYMQGREQGASAMEAALASRKVIADFAQQGGQTMAALSHMTAFLNPAIQHLAANFDNLVKNPTGLAIKGFGAITIPSAMLWYANRNDQDIQDQRKTPSGSAYWFLRMPNGDIGRIPKPFLYGQVFGTTIENGLDKAYAKDPQSAEQLLGNLWGQAGPNMIPSAISTYSQLKDNKDWFTGGSITPESMAQIDPQAQTLPNTSGLAQYVSGYLNKISGGNINVSPIHLDWIAKNTFGGLGRDVTSLTRSDAKSLSDEPFFHRWIAQNPSLNVEPIQTFYDNANQVNTVAKTIDLYAKQGDATKLNAYLSAHANELGVSSMYAETQKQLSTIRSTMTQIQASSMDDENKKNILNELTRQSVELARSVNTAFKNTKQ